MDSLTWFQQLLVIGISVVAAYAIFGLLSLTWRVSNRVLAQAELYEAQAKFYQARAEFIEAKTKLISKKED